MLILHPSIVSTAGSSVGTGGMVTKLVAAELATSAGVTTIITKSSVPGNIHAIIKYLRHMKAFGDESGFEKTGNPTVPSDGIHSFEPDPIQHDLGNADTVSVESALPPDTPVRSPSPPLPPRHTRFIPQSHPIRDRKFWILHGLKSHGIVYIDGGAFKAITRTNKAGLLPAGVLYVKGSFSASEAVSLVVVDKSALTAALQANASEVEIEAVLSAGEDVGKAIVNYSSVEIARIMGLKSSEIESLLGYSDSEYIAHRDNLAFAPKHV